MEKVKKLDTLVIGSGPGGYVAAIRAAQLGQKVTLVERDYIGGVCLNVGCIPSKALIEASKRYANARAEDEMFGLEYHDVSLNWQKTQKWKQEQVVDTLVSGVKFLLDRHGVEIIRGEASFISTKEIQVAWEAENTHYTFNHCIIASGSHPLELKDFRLGERILDSSGVLDLQEIPQRIVFLGGGVIGVELAGLYSRLGSDVTIIEAGERILKNFSLDLVKLVIRQMKKDGVKIITQAQLKDMSAENHKLYLTYEKEGKSVNLISDYLALAIGRKPHTERLNLQAAGLETDSQGFIPVDHQGRTDTPHIFAIGDIVGGPALAHKASYQGKVAAAAISGDHAAAVDYRALPQVVYSQPEIAQVGFSSREAEKRGINVISSHFPLSANGRALSLNDTNGFIRIIADKENQTILGAEVAGPSASELIAILSLAVEGGLNVQDLALTIQAHPTISEGMIDAAEGILGHPIHMV
ncbi:MAG: dihydrolipoyl dehydrogenase [Atopococcus tabaci]|uniref:Dihydrolipoyl dehydrogenase n=1 Tax=Atopococcus tabaci TaxID=269774 RepID=A0AA43UCW6_9LACT|nr:dihydrolipoyl dehydrogenase [Atopococcus tabaci]